MCQLRFEREGKSILNNLLTAVFQQLSMDKLLHKGNTMSAEEKILSKKIIDEYIRQHYKPDTDSSNKSPLGETALGSTIAVATTPSSFVGIPSLILDSVLEKVRNAIELTFSEKLVELIKEKGKKPAEIYKKANVDRALFSKIKGDKNYHPTKSTALAFAIALHLSLEETQDLIGRAGYALSNSINRDLIVRCYIESRIYNIFDINEKLVDYGYDPLTNKY